QQAKTGAAQWDEERETLTLQITAAFFDTELGDGIGFYEANAIDDYMPYEERYAARQQDERVLWERNLAAPKRVSCGNGYTATFFPGSALSFMDGAGRRFALPCYMLWALQDNPMTSDALMSHLQDSGFYEGLNLNAEEQAALYAFIRFMRQQAFVWDEDDIFDGYTAAEQQFWAAYPQVQAA
ncbi:DUF6714 family protein, partial [Kingella denitrificans]|uniref:DUF6714 family protein n=1 Tax=Kingella denitrificans TaxID=502 RepID=UPI00288B15D6